MSDELDYIKKLLKHADAADGKHDGTISIDVTKQYLTMMIARAKSCPEEVLHLQAALAMVNGLKGEIISIPKWAPDFIVNPKLEKKIKEAGGQNLLNWYDTHPERECSGLNYQITGLTSRVKKPAQAGK